MAKTITIRLNEWQTEEVLHALEVDINDDYPMSDKANKRIQRIIDKIEKAKKEQQ